MLTFNEKLTLLENYLSEIKDNYSDSFKTDILFYLEDFETTNKKLNFLKELNSDNEIYNWVDNLTSKIVMKYNENEDQLSDFIYYETL